MRVLLVEDDPKISLFVKIGLESLGFQVDNAYDSIKAEEIAYSEKYDVMILDVNIPGISGFDLCKKLRTNGISTPVIMLTSLDTIEDMITGFECGAGDYLTKPFSFQELATRIKSLVSLSEKSDQERVIKVLDLEVDLTGMKVKRNNKEIFLTAVEFKILNLFISNLDKVMSPVYFTEKILGSFTSGTKVIDAQINSLRNKIDKDYKTKLIHIKNGHGYYMSIDPGKLSGGIPLLP